MTASSLTPHLSPVRTGVSVGTTMGGISVSAPPTQGAQAPGQSLYCSVLLRLSLALSLSLTFKQEEILACPTSCDKGPWFL